MCRKAVSYIDSLSIGHYGGLGPLHRMPGNKYRKGPVPPTLVTTSHDLKRGGAKEGNTMPYCSPVLRQAPLVYVALQTDSAKMRAIRLCTICTTTSPTF